MPQQAVDVPRCRRRASRRRARRELREACQRSLEPYVRPMSRRAVLCRARTCRAEWQRDDSHPHDTTTPLRRVPPSTACRRRYSPAVRLCFISFKRSITKHQSETSVPALPCVPLNASQAAASVRSRSTARNDRATAPPWPNTSSAPCDHVVSNSVPSAARLGERGGTEGGAGRASQRSSTVKRRSEASVAS